MATGGSVDINIGVLHDEEFDFPCTMCLKKNRNKEAKYFCVNCNDNYCDTCIKVHDEVPALSRHRKEHITLSSPPTKTNSGTSHVSTEKCDLHRQNAIDMYCRDHDYVGCGTCIAIDHKQCENTFYIPEYLKTKKKISTKHVKKEVAETLSELNDNLKELKQLKQERLNHKASILRSISQFRKEINDRINELEKKTEAIAVTRFDCIVAELEKKIKKYESMEKSLITIKDSIMSKENNKFQKLISVTKAKHMTRHANRVMHRSKALVADICLNVNHQLRSMLKKIDSLGTISQREPKAIFGVGKCNTFCIKEDSDEEDCSITSACTLHNGMVVLSDAGNKKLKRLECGTFTVVDCCELCEEPMQVCATSMDEVAVSLPFQREVQFATCEDELTLTRTIETDFECCGLSFANGNLYISDRSEFIYVFNLSGQKLLQYNIDQPGYLLSRYISSISISHDGSRIYIADGYNELIILDGKGVAVGKFNYQNLSQPSGSCVTEGGSLLVSGCFSNNVFQFGRDGELLGEVLKADDSSSNNVFQFGRDGELLGEVLKIDNSQTCMQAICCTQHTDQMLIGSNSNNIKVYDLVILSYTKSGY